MLLGFGRVQNDLDELVDAQVMTGEEGQ